MRIALSLELIYLPGDTPDAAILELCGVIAVQLDYALEMGDPGIAIFQQIRSIYLFERYKKPRRGA